MNKIFQFSEYIKLGKIFNQCTAYRISIEYLDKGIKLSSCLPLNKYRLINVYYLRGNSNMFLDNYYEAIVDFSKAIEINNGDYSVFFNRGIDKIYNGDIEASCSDFLKAQKLGDLKALNELEKYCYRYV